MSDTHEMIEADLNRDPEQYTETSDERDARMISYLVDVLLLQQQSAFPSAEPSSEKQAVANWSQVGRAMLGEHPTTLETYDTPSETPFPVPTSAEQDEFLIRLYFGRAYFGPQPDHLAACVNRAYLDFSRTLHGLSELSRAEDLRARASAQVHSELAALSASATASDQGAFDAWHREACERLCAIYREFRFPSFCIGQAQKWLNMAFKYVHVLGESRLPGFARLYALGHVPLDNVMLEQLLGYGAPPLTTAWSRLDDYEEYMCLQRWIRQRFTGSAPLAVEFHLWQSAPSQ